MKEQIIQQAVSLFLEYGFKSVTMDDLSDSLGVSKKTIYEYFNTKAELVEVASAHIFSNISCSIDGIRDKAYDPIRENMAIKNQVMMRLKNEKSSPQFQLQKYYPKTHQKLKKMQWDKMYDCYRDNLERGVKEGFYRDNIDVETIFRLYYQGISLIKDQNLFSHREFPHNKLENDYLEYHIRGIATQKGLNRLEQLLSEETES